MPVWYYGMCSHTDFDYLAMYIKLYIQIETIKIYVVVMVKMALC